MFTNFSVFFSSFKNTIENSQDIVEISDEEDINEDDGNIPAVENARMDDEVVEDDDDSNREMPNESLCEFVSYPISFENLKYCLCRSFLTQKMDSNLIYQIAG